MNEQIMSPEGFDLNSTRWKKGTTLKDHLLPFRTIRLEMLFPTRDLLGLTVFTSGCC